MNIKNYHTGRIEYIDFIKGMGMLFVMWAHVMVYGYSTNFFYAFHMPLFFFMSGVMFSPDKYQSILYFIKRRVKSLLVPYFIYSFITWVVWAAYSRLLDLTVENYIDPLLQTFLAQGSGGFLVHNTPLWFVTCLFVVEILFFKIRKLGEITSLLICAVLTVLGYLMIEVFSFFDFTRLPWSVEVAFATIIFYCVGFYSKDIISKMWHTISNASLKSINYLILADVILAVIVLIISIFVGHISFGSDRLGTYPIAVYCNAFIGITFSIILCMLLESRKNAFGSGYRKAINMIEWVGMNSFKIMAVHVPIKGALVVLTSKALKVTSEYVQGKFLPSCFVFLSTLIITVIITRLTIYVQKRVAARKA